MRSIYDKIMERAGDVFDKTSVDGVKGPDHYFVSISPDDSKCVMFTHSTGKNRSGRVPTNNVLEWYVKCNYAVGDKHLIYVDASQLFENKLITGGGCIDVSTFYSPKDKNVVTRASGEALAAIMTAIKAPSLRGKYWDNGLKDVYNKECYSIFLESRLPILKRMKGFVSADVYNYGIVIEWDGDYYVDEVRQDVEIAISTPHYNVTKNSDARSKGNFKLLISK